jgi:glycosyltransferase involved in cell wall biosynthesis
MKILQIVKTSSGAVWAFQQAKYLSEKGVSVITILPDTDGSTAKRYLDSGMEVIVSDFSLPVTKPWKIVSRIKEIKRIVDSVKPDIIHMHFVTNAMMVRIALRQFRIPRIFQVPGPLHLESSFFRRLEISTSQKSDFWIRACKKTCQYYLNAGIESDRVFLGYYGGYGGQACDEYSPDTGILHAEYGIHRDADLVGMVSYFYKPKWYLGKRRGIKGHEDFIDAISIVRKTNPQVIGVIIGGPWIGAESYEKKVRQYAEKVCPEGIIFTGMRHDLKRVYRELAVAVHPSHSENLGGAAESLAAGVPTVSTTVGGFTDIVLDHVTGLTVPPKNPQELSSAILSLLNDKEEAQKLATEGRELVRDMLDIESCGNRIYEIYSRILGKKHIEMRQLAGVNNE